MMKSLGIRGEKYHFMFNLEFYFFIKKKTENKIILLEYKHQLSDSSRWLASVLHATSPGKEIKQLTKSEAYASLGKLGQEQIHSCSN